MVLTPSTMLPIGTPLASFRLPDPSGRLVDSAELAGRPLLVAFLCNHCPYVKHIAPYLSLLGRDYLFKGVGIIAINSNDASSYPADSPEQMVHESEERGYYFPYLYDETQEVAKAYQAACTPDFFVFDRHQKLVYRGQLDSSRPGNDIPVTGEDLRAALDAVLAGKPVPEPQKPSMGCNIKWKSGNEPEYFGKS